MMAHVDTAVHRCPECGDEHYRPDAYRALGVGMLTTPREADLYPSAQLFVAIAMASLRHDLPGTLAALARAAAEDHVMQRKHPELVEDLERAPLGAIAAIVALAGAVHDVLVEELKGRRNA